MERPARYKAFFSYARPDEKTAGWLHRQLDRYRTPAALRKSLGAFGRPPARLHPIFRDRTDLQAGGELSISLQRALEESEALIVLCSPLSAKSHWVNLEVERFQQLGRQDRIFPVIAAGEPDSADPNLECFPPALRGRSLLAADLRRLRKPNGQLIGDGRDIGRMKLISGLLGLPLDALLRRERQRQRLTIGAAALAATAFAAIAIFAVTQTIAANANLIEANRQQGIAQANAAEAVKQTAVAEAKALAEMREKERADIESARARASAEEAQRQAGLANQSANEARAALDRMFARKANDLLKSNQPTAAARYALAGLQLSPENMRENRNILSRVLSSASLGHPPLVLGGAVTDIAFLKGGTRAIVRTLDDDRLRLFDLGPDPNIQNLSARRHDVFKSLVVSPDGEKILAVGALVGPLVWQVGKDGALSMVSLRSRGDSEATGLARFDRSGKYIGAAGGTGRPFEYWDAENLKLIARVPFAGSLRDFQFTDDPARIVLRTSEGITLLSLDGSDESRTIRPKQSGSEPYDELVISADGKLLALPEGSHVAFYDTASGASAGRIGPVSGPVSAMAFAPAGRRIAIGTTMSELSVWSTDAVARVWASARGAGQIEQIAFSPAGTELAITIEDDTAEVWRADSGKLVGQLWGHAADVSVLAFSPDGEGLLTGGVDKSVRTWPRETWSRARDLSDRGQNADVREFAVKRDVAVTVTSRGEGVIWRRRPGGDYQPVMPWDTEDGPNSVSRLELSGDASTLAVGYNDGTIQIVDVESGKVQRSWDTPDSVFSLAFSKDGRQLFSGSRRAKQVQIWDVGTGKETGRFGDFADLVWQIQPTIKGNQVATVDQRNGLQLWNTRTGALEEPLPCSRRARTFSFSPDGNRVAVGGLDEWCVWDLVRKKLIVRIKDETNIEDMSFSDDGARLILAHYRGESRFSTVDALSGEKIADFGGGLGCMPDLEYLTGKSELAGLCEWKVKLFDVSPADKPVGWLADETCANFLTPSGRSFLPAEIDADPLLMARWPEANRDVCALGGGRSSLSALTTSP